MSEALVPPEASSTWTPPFRHHWGDGDTDGMDCQTIQEEYGDQSRLLDAVASIDLLINNGPQGQHPRWMFDCYADLPDAVAWWMNVACALAMQVGMRDAALSNALREVAEVEALVLGHANIGWTAGDVAELLASLRIGLGGGR